MFFNKFLKPLAFCCVITATSNSHGKQIICDIDVSDSQYNLAIKPSTDVYDFFKIDTAGDFRFVAQYLPELGKFKTYVYHNSKNRFVLISAQEFFINPNMCTKDFGRTRIYASSYERELFFKCSQLCND